MNCNLLPWIAIYCHGLQSDSHYSIGPKNTPFELQKKRKLLPNPTEVLFSRCDACKFDVLEGLQFLMEAFVSCFKAIVAFHFESANQTRYWTGFGIRIEKSSHETRSWDYRHYKNSRLSNKFPMRVATMYEPVDDNYIQKKQTIYIKKQKPGTKLSKAITSSNWGFPRT